MSISENSPNNIASLTKILQSRRRSPLTTYRLQVNKDFGFQKATAIIPYLEKLGITDCYTSPLLKARPGSTHGYDITDHQVLNPELGSEDDYISFTQTLEKHHMGHLLDFVPNHMGIDPETNLWWKDILENGPSSPYARYFDIDWSPIKPELKNKVLLPILGDLYGAVLERAELQLVLEKGSIVLCYFDQHLPINPRELPKLLKSNLRTLQNELKDDPQLREFLSILTGLSNLPSSAEKNPERIEERQREKEIARERLAKVLEKSPRLNQYVLDCLTILNGKAGQPASFDALHEFLEAQAYRLAYWKTALHEINYRRFFDVNQLAGLCMEKPNVFEETHARVLQDLVEGKTLGLRIDHPDGLYDPAVYFEALQEAFLSAWLKKQYPVSDEPVKKWDEAIRAWRIEEWQKDPSGITTNFLYVVAEKILSKDESLRRSWAIDGTSGYDFLNQVSHLFIDTEGGPKLQAIYDRFTKKTISLEEEIYRSKKLIMSTSMASELNVLAHQLNDISETNRRWRDFTLDSLRDALREVVACFPVYRTYIADGAVSPSDELVITKAIAQAKRLNPAMEATIFDFVYRMLIPKRASDLTTEEYEHCLRFAMKFQQYTGPVQAKGLEDTAFYRHNVLISRNEVGAHPDQWGLSVSDFHLQNQERLKFWPFTLLATATHDTKRGEDSRVRLNVLSEIPDEWENAVLQWATINKPFKTKIDNELAPDANDEYLFYQTLLGAWSGVTDLSEIDSFRQRLKDYMQKALREAKRHTSWIRPNTVYEQAMVDFIDKVLEIQGKHPFWDVFKPFAQRVANTGKMNSLAQVVLKISSPGVPDFYQGSELWDWSLVDPDNRRPVDYDRRNQFLQEIDLVLKKGTTDRITTLQQKLEAWEDGWIKLFITTCVLRLRRDYSDLFIKGTYVPLSVTGERSQHLISYKREDQTNEIIIVVPKTIAHFKSIFNGWESTKVLLDSSDSTYRNVFTNEEVAIKGDLLISELLTSFPILMLLKNKNLEI